MTRFRGLGVAVLLTVTVTGAGCSDRRSTARAPHPTPYAPLETVPPQDAAAPATVDPAALAVTPTAPEVQGVRGQIATATFRTRPGNSCQLEVRDAAGLTSERMAPSTADDQGVVSWSWSVSGDATPGHATAFVACSGGARGQATLVVS